MDKSMQHFQAYCRALIGIILLLTAATTARAEQQDSLKLTDTATIGTQSKTVGTQSKNKPAADSLLNIQTESNDSLLMPRLKKPKRDWSNWRPDPKRALWLALVLPGGGQIYNRKYWKLPIIYGGFMGCVYAMNWNNMMYRDYSQAYLDIMDSDPNTCSYNKFLHLGNKIDASNEERYKEIFKKRKDRYRRWRDMSFFCLIGVYALSVIDAYVDAELSEFDISKDLTLRVEPTVINNQQNNTLPAAAIGNAASHSGTSLGLQCSLNF